MSLYSLYSILFLTFTVVFYLFRAANLRKLFFFIQEVAEFHKAALQDAACADSIGSIAVDAVCANWIGTNEPKESGVIPSDKKSGLTFVIRSENALVEYVS